MNRMSDQIKKAKAAGGVPAIVAAVKSISNEMGLVRGMRTLLQVNQSGGVDCPGCAWPEPDRERSHFEFCENGAKHIADEATTKRVTPEFFRQWSVADLEQHVGGVVLKELVDGVGDGGLHRGRRDAPA